MWTWACVLGRPDSDPEVLCRNHIRRGCAKGNDMRNHLALLLLTALCSCTPIDRTGRAPPNAPMALNKDFRREQHEAFAPRERDMIASARRYLARSNRRPEGASADAYYRVRHTDGGYEVFVIYVTGYDGNKPLLQPCLHNEVFLREDGSVIKVLAGPECWPSP